MNRNEPFIAPRDPATLRRRQPYNEALPATLGWVASLPAEVRPLALLVEFPRIANILARAWNDAADFQGQMEDLLVDRRGSRSGFPLEVLEDLLTLRDYYLGRYPHLPSPPERADS